MAAVLKHQDCPSCGHRHHFFLFMDHLEPGYDYTFVCPETGDRATLRPQSSPELCRYHPQGAVHLSPAEAHARA